MSFSQAPRALWPRFGVIAAKSRELLILDAMVLAAGLTSRREPASNSRRLIELATEGRYGLVVTDTLLQEAYAVLIQPGFVGRLDPAEAADRVSALAGIAETHLDDAGVVQPRLTSDPNDDYLAAAAIATGAFLVSRDEAAKFEDVPGLRVGRPGTARRLLDDYE